MKKLSVLLAAIVALTSCNNTTTKSQDMQMLQSKYSVVYNLNMNRFITCDSAHVYDVWLYNGGTIKSIVKIK